MDLRFKHPFTCIVGGPTKAGKTVFVKNLVKCALDMIVPVPERIIWCYTEWQPAYQELGETVTMIEGLPDLSDLRSYKKPQLVILDDLMQELKRDPRLVQIFTRGCHHWNLSCVHVVQNVFFEGLRTSRINAQYLILMKNPADQSQIVALGKQLFPGKHKYFVEAYQDACSQPFSYLLIDLNQDTDDRFRLRTKVFPSEMQVVYVPKL